MFRLKYPIIALRPPVIRMLEFVLEGPMNLRVATIFDTLRENLASGLLKGRLTFNKEQRLSEVVVLMILTTVIMQMIGTIKQWLWWWWQWWWTYRWYWQWRKLRYDDPYDTEDDNDDDENDWLAIPSSPHLIFCPKLAAGPTMVDHSWGNCPAQAHHSRYN